MKIHALISLALASALVAGAAHAEQKTSWGSPLSACEQKVVDSCEAQYPETNPTARDQCEISGFANCKTNGGLTLTVRTGVTAIGTVGGIYTPPKQTVKPVVVAPKTTLKTFR